MDNLSQQETEIFNNNRQVALPNATSVLVLGIVSIVTCCCYGIVGLICGIIALVLAKKDNLSYRLNPELYTAGSYSNLKGGKICAIIGIILSALYLIFALAIIGTIGLAALNDPQQLQEWLRAHQQ